MMANVAPYGRTAPPDLDGGVCEVTRHGRGALPRHRHATGYIAIVLAGGYVEAGDGGRWRAGPGTVIVHAAHEAHRDAFEAGETLVLNLPAAGMPFGQNAGLIDDIDTIANLAMRDPAAALEQVAAEIRPGAHRLADWPDLLADAIGKDPGLSIAHWADMTGLSPASVSRGFFRAFGVSPKRFRLEARTRRAIRAVSFTCEPLAQIAAENGFADQAHMTRALRGIAGTTPADLRAKSVQSASMRAR